MSYWMIYTVVIFFVLQKLVGSAIASANITGKANCYGFMEFYADGVRYHHANDNAWMKFSPIKISSSTKVVASRCENRGGQCGLKVYLDNGVKTDTSWKCSNNEEDGWTNVRFDDSAWANAKLLPRASHLIWTSMKEWEVGVIYCRKTIRFGSYHRNASYSKSNIVINTCDPSRFLEKIYTPWEMDCSRACTRKVDCRRYLYCSRDASCKLYQDGRDCVMSGDTTGCSCYKQIIRCEDSDCTCPLGKYGEGCQDTISDCTDGSKKGLNSTNGVLTNIKPLAAPDSVEVLCTFDDGGWTGILGRDKDCLHESFNRTLEEYEAGFGNVASNKWLGFKHVLYLLDNPNSTFSLRAVLINPDSSTCVSQYTNFAIGNRSTSYRLYISGFDGNGTTCGDSLTGTINLNNNTFSTYDADYTGTFECTKRFGAGWWYDSQDNCTSSLLTGTMDGSRIDNFWDESMPYSPLNQIHLLLQRN